MNLTRKWLVETPLAPAWRRRLELALGAVVTSAAVVALGTTFRPEAATVDRLHGVTPLVSRSFPPAEEEGPGSIEAVRAAAAKGDIAGMRRAWRRGMDLDSALPDALRSGKLDAVRWLAARGMKLKDNPNPSFGTLVAADPYPDIVVWLHEQGVEESLLQGAAGAHAPNAVRRILAKDPHPPLLDVSLYYAVTQHDYSILTEPTDAKTDVVKQLLAAGANANESSFGTSVLAGAIQNCTEDCAVLVHELLDHGARVTGDAVGAALSLEDGRQAMLDLLLASPIDKGVAAGALETASSVKLEDVPRILANGVEWNFHDGENDGAHPVVAAARRGDRDLLRLLLDAHAPVDTHYKDGTSALAEAVDGNDVDHARVVELLVERGANPNRRFPDGRTPLFAAAEAGQLRVVSFLLARGARVNDLVLEDTALDIAEQSGNTPAARVIAAHGGQHGRRWNLFNEPR